MPSHAVPPNRERALAAATELLGTQGVRALTHRRVDERAGLPKGSTSNYFRTRAALVHGVVEHMVASEIPAIGVALAPASEDELLEGLTNLFEFLTGPNRVTTAARLALFVEAGHDEALRAALARGRAEIERTVVPALEALGAADPALAAQALAVTFEGLFLHVIGRHATVDARAVLGLVVHAALAGGSR